MPKFEIITAVDEKNRACVAYLMVDIPGTSDSITVCKAVAKCHPDDTLTRTKYTHMLDLVQAVL